MPYPTFPVSNVHSISLLGSLNDSFVVVVVVGGVLGELVIVLTIVYGCVRRGRWCNLCEYVRILKGIVNVVHLLQLFFGSNICVFMVYAKNIHVTNMLIEEKRANLPKICSIHNKSISTFEVER